jgi:hypothetical protein
MEACREKMKKISRVVLVWWEWDHSPPNHTISSTIKHQKAWPVGWANQRPCIQDILNPKSSFPSADLLPFTNTLEPILASCGLSVTQIKNARSYQLVFGGWMAVIASCKVLPVSIVLHRNKSCVWAIEQVWLNLRSMEFRNRTSSLPNYQSSVFSELQLELTRSCFGKHLNQKRKKASPCTS